jgi:rsbT co-antagonist protein RsbR
MSAAVSLLAKLISSNESEVLSAWMGKLRNMGGDGGGRIREEELQSQCKHVLAEFMFVLVSGDLSNFESLSFAGEREALARISRSRAVQVFTPSETAVFIFSL